MAGRARLSLPFRVQYGLDAAGVRRARRRIRSAGTWAALDRKRMGPRPGRMHFRAAHGARSRRQRAAVPHRDAADLPAARLFRDFHGAPGAQRFLFQRLASASIADRCGDRRESVHAATSRRSSFAARPVLPRRPAAIRGAGHRFCYADGQWLSALPSEFAGAGSRRPGPTIIAAP